MGQPKALLTLAGETLFHRQVRVLREVARFVAVVGPPEIFEGANSLADVPRWPDELPGRGPLGGIYTALLRTRTELNLVLGCDMPFAEAAFLRYLCARALSTRADVTVPESRDRRLNTLCAVYRRRALSAVRGSLASGENKVSAFFPRVHSRVLAWRELAKAGFSPRIFDNLNTPEDYDQALRRLKSEG